MFRTKPESWLLSLARKLRPVLPYGVLANLKQWVTRYTHEPDFEVFEWLAHERGLVLDVGANRGQSAISVLRRTRRMRVFSVEPNRKHRWSLLLIRVIHPFRFRFRMVAAGNTTARKNLHVPGRRASGLSAQGSLDPAEFDKDYVRQRLRESGFDAADKAAYRLVPASVLPLDHLGLSPDLVKLDVEGFEFQALRGLQATLERENPVLLIEINNIERWMPFLETLGYAFYYYDPGADALYGCSGHPGVLNLFCIHAKSRSAISRILLDRVASGQ